MLLTDALDTLLMIPGPTPVTRTILDALGSPTMSHTSPAVAAIVQRCLTGIKHTAESTEGQGFVFAGAGTLAQEAAVINLVKPGECLAVASNGFFGDRFVAIAEAHGIEVRHIRAEWGQSVTPEQMQNALKAGGVRAVTITHVDTSTGVLAPVAELARTARDHGALVILDAVCSLGGVPTAMDRDGIDIVLSGAQKALGVPPGLAILVGSAQALARRRELGRINSYYADLLNWEASMADPKVYFSTHAVNLFYALEESLAIIEREGLRERFERHECQADAFRAGMRALGFVSLADADYLAPTLSVLAYPDGIEDESFRAALAARGVVAAGCLGAFKGRGVRFGHMGNISASDVLAALLAVEQTLSDLGHGVIPGSALAAAALQLQAQPQ